MTKKKKEKKLTKSQKLALGLVGVVLFSIVSFIAIGNIIPLVVGESEFQSSIVAMGIGQSSQTQGAFLYDFINTEVDDKNTADYSTWRPDRSLSNYPQHKVEKYEWDIDPDYSVYGAPNVQVNTKSEYYPTDDEGNWLEEFVVEDKDITFYDDNGTEWTVFFYQTFIGMQFSVIVHGGMDIVPWDNWAGDPFVGQASRAETPATYQCNQNDNKQQSFLGYGADFRIVFRNQIKEYKVGEKTHSDPYAYSANAIFMAKTSTVVTEIEDTMGWRYKGDFSGSLISDTQLTMYPTAKDALLRTTQLSSKDVDDIDLEDTFYDTVYLGFDYDVKLGANWNTWGAGTNEWATYNEEGSSVDIQSWGVLVNVFFSIITAYGAPIDFAEHAQYVDIDNPFNYPDVIDDKFNLIDWMVDTFGWSAKTARTVMVVAIIVIIIILFGAIMAAVPGLGKVLLIPLKFVGRGIKTGATVAGTAASAVAERIEVRSQERQKVREKERKKKEKGTKKK